MKKASHLYDIKLNKIFENFRDETLFCWNGYDGDDLTEINEKILCYTPQFTQIRI